MPRAPVGGLEQHLLLSEPLLLVLPESSRPREPVDLATLRDAPWIGGLVGTQFAAALERMCRRAGFTPQVAHRADDATLHHALVEAGLGVGLLPALACTGPHDVRYARVKRPRPQRHVTALVRRGVAARPALAAALDALREAARPL